MSDDKQEPEKIAIGRNIPFLQMIAARNPVEFKKALEAEMRRDLSYEIARKIKNPGQYRIIIGDLLDRTPIDEQIFFHGETQRGYYFVIEASILTT